VQDLANKPSSITSLIYAASSDHDVPDTQLTVGKSCHIEDKVIQQFLDGAGI